MTRSDMDELIVDFYLRLNGYFTTGLIIHSADWGQAKTEIDRLAIRNQFHSQDEREIECSQFLGLKNHQPELIFCEVKSDKESLRFNDALLRDESSVASALRWSGLFPPEDIDSLSTPMLDLFKRSNDRDGNVSFGIECNNIVVRALLCCPSEESIDEGWVLDGKEIFGFINNCLSPEQRRENCSTRYNFQQWGYPFSKIVRYFKDESQGNPTASELYSYMGCT